MNFGLNLEKIEAAANQNRDLDSLYDIPNRFGL